MRGQAGEGKQARASRRGQAGEGKRKRAKASSRRQADKYLNTSACGLLVRAQTDNIKLITSLL
jgi:hypothetical protein